MTDDHRWDPEEEEIVRRALASLRDDVDAHPLPEPESVRELGSKLHVISSRRHRTVGVLAGAAAAAVVAASAGILTWNSSDVAPPASSSTFAGTSSSTTEPVAVGEGLVVLGAREWSGALDRTIPSTVTPEGLDGPCISPDPDSNWEHRVARLGDGDIAARQWVGTDEDDPQRLRDTVDEAVASCTDSLSLEQVDSGRLGDGRYRLWQASPDDGPDQWWLEVRRGTHLSFITVTEDGPAHSAKDLRRLGLGVLGGVDLADIPREPTPTDTPSGTDTPTSTSTPSSPSPTSTEEPPVLAAPRPTGSDDSDTSSSPSGTRTPSSSDDAEPSTPPSAAAEPEQGESTTPEESPDDEGGHPQVGGVAARHYVPAERWASPALTGGEPSFEGPVEMEGRSYLSMCTSADSGDRIGAIGIRSGEGDMNYFGRQYILLTDDASERYDELLEGITSGCTGAAATSLGNGVYKVGDGDFVEYLGMVRIGSGVTILHLSEAQTAPGPLTDDVAHSELSRLLGLAATH